MRTPSLAVIFDMNGVIVNDERYHQLSWVELFKKYNITLTPEEFKNEVYGRTDFDTIRFAFGSSITKNRIDDLCNERDQIVMNLIGKKLPIVDGIIELLEKLKKNSIPMAIATSSRLEYAKFVINSLKINEYFQSISTAEEIVEGKPSPEIYLLAARKLGISPILCTAIEDSISGIKSAMSAEMFCVAITTTHKQEEIAFANKVISTFKEIDIKSINLP